VLGALLAKFDGILIEHGGTRATIRWFGSTVYAGEKSLFVLMELATSEARAGVLELDMSIVVAPRRQIDSEWRRYVLAGKVPTGSSDELYGDLAYSTEIPDELRRFAAS
jgi:hypothetical protein